MTGEQDGQLTYGSYLRVPEVLDQQILQSDPPLHDEMLFIVLHQAYELWFKELLHELTAVRDAMLGDGLAETSDRPTWLARQLMRRVLLIERLLISQIDVLETMAPQEFGELRVFLGSASGFQSAQFRELEYLSGARDAQFVTRLRWLTDDERVRLGRRLTEPTLWDAFVDLLASRGLAVGSQAEIIAALAKVARNRAQHDDLWQLAEDLLTHDELAAVWRTRHVQLVERQIGAKSGTGGSSGARYLRSRAPLRYYPLLWELRDSL
jgi:tryptophan 2,3-dioxygenase